VSLSISWALQWLYCLFPNLQWKDTPHTVDQVFVGFDSATLPLGGTPALVCNHTQLVARNYSCTADTYASSLDSWADITLAIIDQDVYDNVSVLADGSSWGVSEEAAVSFTLNFTNDNNNDYINWSPNRKVLRAISDDYAKFYFQETGTLCDPDCQASNSLQTILTREGPIVGPFQNTYSVNLTSLVTFADKDPSEKSIRCYSPVNITDNPEEYPSSAIGKCIRVGNLWSSTNSVAQFSISSTNETTNGVSVDIYFSDRATYYLEGALPACLAGGEAPTDDSCNWDTIFSQSTIQALNLTPFLNSLANNLMTVEMRLSDSPHNTGRLNTESVAFGSIATYILDTSTSSIGMVQVDGLGDPTNEAPLVVDADWILAAWSSDENGTLTQNRSSTIALCEAVGILLSSEAQTFLSSNNTDEGISVQIMSSIEFIEISIDQAMSMTGYNNTTSIPTASPDATPLNHWAQEYVWTYGLGSRTSMLGTAVAIIGILCVIFQVLLQLCTHIEVRPTDELIGAALAHEPGNNFNVHKHVRRKVRLNIHDEDGELKFEPLVESHSRVSVHQPQNDLSFASLNSHLVSPPIDTGDMEHSDTEYMGA
jgi:hypothetical protein